MSAKTWFQLLIFVVSIPTWPFIGIGFVIGFFWAALTVGFFWGDALIDKMFDREEQMVHSSKDSKP